jgi:hypothetical protein
MNEGLGAAQSFLVDVDRLFPTVQPPTRDTRRQGILLHYLPTQDASSHLWVLDFILSSA